MTNILKIIILNGNIYNNIGVHQKNKKGTQLKNYFIRFKFYSKYNNVDRKINISKWFI